MPENIRQSDLGVMSSSCARGLAAGNLTAVCVKSLLAGGKSVGEAWADAVQAIYLEPMGITSDTHFSWSKETVADIKSRNPSLSNARFLLPSNEERPFSIIGTTLVGPSKRGNFGVGR